MGSKDDWLQDEAEFEALFAEKSQEADKPRYNPGDEVSARVVHVGERFAQLDIDGRDGLLDLGTSDAERPAVGDVVKGYVLRYKDRTFEIATGMPRGKVDLSALYTASQSGMPIEGRVAEVNKGGYVVDVGNDVRAFCPLGQMDIRRIEDPSELVGAKLMFKVLEMRDGRDPVLSRKAVLLAEQESLAAETRKSLVVGARLRGRVTRIMDFGCFVDLGGIEGLVHVSELGYGRRRTSEIVQPDQMVEVEVLRIEPAVGDRRERIGLSMRALAADPMETALDELSAGLIVRGTVTRIQPWGAFVEIATGVEGLLHVSAFGKRVATPKEMCALDDKVVVRIKGVDQALRRIALAWVGDDKLDEVRDATQEAPKVSLHMEVLGVAAPQGDEGAQGEASQGARERKVAPPAPKVGTLLDVIIERHARFGVFVGWPGGGEGLVPFAELGVPHGTDLRRNFAIGSKLEVVVDAVRPDGKVRLSKVKAELAKEKAEADAWLSKQQSKSTDDEVGSFGALLKAKLGL